MRYLRNLVAIGSVLVSMTAFADPPAPGTAIPAECRGAVLDLNTIASTKACRVEARPAPLPSSIKVTIDPAPVKVASGGQTKAALVFANTSAVETTMYFNNDCDAVSSIRTVILDAKGNRADLIGDICEENGACGDDTIRVALPPKGELRLTLDVDARKEKVGHDCNSQRTGRVAPGTYVLALFHEYGGRFGTAQTELRVK